jgi:hypothetical protein
MPPYEWIAPFRSSRAPSEVITTGTLCLTHMAMSSSSRLLLLWTIWLTANGAEGASGLALS